MHIAHLTRIIWEHGIRGGMEQHSRLLIRGLRDQGHFVTTITTSLPTTVPSNTIYVPDSYPARYSQDWWRGSVASIAHLHRQRPIHIIWSQSTGARAYAIRQRRTMGIPCVFTLHGTLYGEFKTRWRNARSWRGIASMSKLLMLTWLPDRWGWQRAIPYVDHFIAVSDKVAEEAIQAMRIPVNKLTVIPNGVDTAHLQPQPARHAALRQELGLTSDAHLLMTAGRLQVSKGFHLAIEVVEQLQRPNVHLLIAGVGPHEAALRQQSAAKRLGQQVHFLGFVPNEQLVNYFQGVDLFLMPTLRNEGLPIVLLEAMSCGLPIVVTEAGGIPTAIQHQQNGLLVPMGELPALVRVVQQLLDTPRLAERLGHAARATAVARFSLETMTRHTEAVFQQVVIS